MSRARVIRSRSAGPRRGCSTITSPFAEAGIPSLDLIDFDYGPGPAPGAYWHTRSDTVGHVCADSLDAIGEASVEALPELADAGE